ncbi:MAG: nucleotidyltransferase domain-containing protein [Nanoarchaeota archaeon]
MASKKTYQASTDANKYTTPADLAPMPEASQGMPPQLTPQQQAVLAQKAKEFLDSIKNKADDFQKEITTKFKKETIGLILLPPRPVQSCLKCGSNTVKVLDEFKGHCTTCNSDFNTLDMLILMQFEGANLEEKFKKKDEADIKIKEIAQKKLPQINVSSVLLDEVWDMCFKGKYDILNLLTMGVILYDTGMVGALKASEIHKRMVLQKFEKYVVTYAIGGSLVKGRATKESDIDTFVVIDDTDVTRMTGVELISKLRAIILGMASESGFAAGVGNKMNVQIYVLTDMWNNIKTANPVIFTLLRDGIPLYDRGMFAPWKLLLKQGKITPTPEAVDMYMKSGRQMVDRTKFTLRNIAMEDFFWATLTPAQGALMLMGVPPPDPKETPAMMREYLVKSGLLEEKYVKILEDILQLRKDFEHGKIKDIDAKTIGEYMDNTEKFLTRLDKLMVQIETQEVKKELKQLNEKLIDDLSASLKMLDVKFNSDDVVKQFEKNVVAKKLAHSKYLELIGRVVALHKEGKGDRREIASLAFEQDRLAKDVFEHIRAEKGKKVEKYKISAHYGENKKADIWLLTDSAFIVMDTAKADTMIRKFAVDKDGCLVKEAPSNLKELNVVVEKFAGTPTTLTKSTIDSLKKILAENVKLVVGA